MNDTTKQATRQRIAAMSSEDYTALRDAYFDTSDGLIRLQDQQDLLTSEERQAVEALQAAFAKLNHLAAAL